MGQATLDLPDPIEFNGQLTGIDAGPMSPEALASADDLLSQLAGDDIDRLLAEAETERAAAPPVSPSVSPTPAPAISPTIPPAPDPVQDAQAAEPRAAEPPAPQPAEPIVVGTGAEAPAIVETKPAQDVAQDPASSTAAALDAILATAVDSAAKSVAPSTNQPAEQQTTAAPPQTLESTALPASPGQEHALEQPNQNVLNEAAAHVAAIMEPPPAEPIAPSAVADAAERQALAEPLLIPSSATSGKISPLVQVLEWINWPMTLVSDEIREAIGKVAIVTTINAAAVIIYVLMFRHPHH